MSTAFELPTDYDEIIKRIDQIDPVRYAKSRNFINGAVTQLSPYISRGVIEPATLLKRIAEKGYTYYQCEKFIQQICWREYFQKVWQNLNEEIDVDIKHQQTDVVHRGISVAICNAQTSIEAIDTGIQELISSGMMHNHLRMYIAFLACNLGKAHWLHPAKWMYYHLLDGDWGSNALSWQWVAGTFSSKKYIANQENINYYTGIQQFNTFLDLDYDTLQQLHTPEVLRDEKIVSLKTKLPEQQSLAVDPSLPTLIYNYYNLSPTWKTEITANRILLLEPEIFEKYPIADHCVKFMFALAENIKGIQPYIGSFQSLKSLLPNSSFYFKDHPLNNHYTGIKEKGNGFLFDAKKTEGSFFSFWKKNEPSVKNLFNSY